MEGGKKTSSECPDLDLSSPDSNICQWRLDNAPLNSVFCICSVKSDSFLKSQKFSSRSIIFCTKNSVQSKSSHHSTFFSFLFNYQIPLVDIKNRILWVINLLCIIISHLIFKIPFYWPNLLPRNFDNSSAFFMSCCNNLSTDVSVFVQNSFDQS